MTVQLSILCISLFFLLSTLYQSVIYFSSPNFYPLYFLSEFPSFFLNLSPQSLLCICTLSFPFFSLSVYPSIFLLFVLSVHLYTCHSFNPSLLLLPLTYFLFPFPFFLLFHLNCPAFPHVLQFHIFLLSPLITCPLSLFLFFLSLSLPISLSLSFSLSFSLSLSLSLSL